MDLQKALFILLILFMFNSKAQELKLPDGQEISKASAINDIHYNTKMYWIVYGELNDYACEAIILKKYSLKIHKLGCEISKELIDKINSYNTVIDAYMKQAYDPNWKIKLFNPELDCENIKLDFN
ncbi:hypothetical protein [Aurantibacter sp.]|uniref:FEKKY domain-containing protein n=1 Tax=Aurantibacter sp. TaxID=2807103 RepID=UPI0035C8688C